MANELSPMPGKELAKAREKTKIGIWYSIWYNLGKDCFWDNDGCGNYMYYRPLCPDGKYRRYASDEDAIIQYHLEQITEAGIDFVILDQTNMIDNAFGGGIINKNALKFVNAIHEWNKSGKKRIKYCSAQGAFAGVFRKLSIIEDEAKILWERYCEQDYGTEDDHMFVDGKPLMVIFTITKEEWDAYDGDKTYANKFTMRFSVGHAWGPDMWGWVIPGKTHVTEDVACLMPGWYKFNHGLKKVYRDGGRHYKEVWETVLGSDVIPNHIVINSFNEYAEHTAVFTANTDDFPDDYPIEKWVDAKGNPAPSLYWDYTKQYIKKYRDGDVK